MPMKLSGEMLQKQVLLLSYIRCFQTPGSQRTRFNPYPVNMWFLIFASCLAVASAKQEYIHYDTSHYHGPPAPLDKIGRVVDTPEVAHAKAAHFSAYHAEAAKSAHYGPSYDQGGYGGGEGAGLGAGAGASHGHVEHYYYHGPPAPLAHDGRVIDTPEVAHAKSAHFHAYQEALSKVSHKPEHSPEPHGYF